MRKFIGLVVFLAQLSVAAQGIEVEYDKAYDFSRHKTFRVEKGEVIIPKELQNVDPAVVHSRMKQALISKLTSKGLLPADSAADLTVSYAVGTRKQTDRTDLGPQILGGVTGNTPSTPNNASQTWSREYQEGFIFIDVADRGKNIRWRVKAISTEGSIDEEGVIQETVNAGFKKFSLKPKRNKK